MSNTNAYIIFEPDQVLTNDHLNELFEYLDTQERLTRNKLIGIGIVCGLEIDYQTNSILISKGCGVTSKGYLIVQEETAYAQYISYTLPANPLYSPFIRQSTGKQYDLWRLLSEEDVKKTEGTKTSILQPSGFLNDKIVVLFLEAFEIDLKNCDMQDCNEKGKQMEFTVRPLLIAKRDMEEIIIKQKKLSGEDGLSDSYIERLGLKEVSLKRFDVKATPLVDAFDIYDAYLKCLDDATIKEIAEVYSQSYSIFKNVLEEYSSNPFITLYKDLLARLDLFKKSMPIYIQYYYDFIDDLIKAYHEFREKSFEIITECCPDEDLFPMHLMLGEATVDTRDYIRSPFRQYFISSPLFNQQRELLSETKLLFDRMVQLTKNFFITPSNPRQPQPIRITPSKWSSAPLSARSIPYYYNINNVARSWSVQKTKKGKSNHNLSYNADKYNSQPPDAIVNPLLYSIEPYNFYRIEGHIGQQFPTVLNSILMMRNSHRLPFDIIALKAGTDADNTEIKYNCHFEDLETAFHVLKSELACKVHEPVCLVAKISTALRPSTAVTGVVTDFRIIELMTDVHARVLTERIETPNLVETKFITQRFTRKGDFLKTYCTVKEGTLGDEYLKSTSKFFPRPTTIDLATIAGSKAALLHLIDIVEGLMQTITATSTIYSFNFPSFSKLYSLVTSYFTALMQALLAAEGNDKRLSPLFYGMLEAVVSSCIDERIKAIMDEYKKRVEKIQKQNLLSEYLKNNPGIDHKAGVPRGGTFVLVYHEAPPEKQPQVIERTTGLMTDLDTARTAGFTTDVTGRRLASTSGITTSNMNKLMNLFESRELQLTDVQAEALKKLVINRFADVNADRDPFVIGDKVVVADFYLPYLCCSDCPPVTYILPREDKPVLEALSIKLNKTDFCNNDAGVYKITVSPEGGKLTAAGGGVDADKFEFRPKDLPAGLTKITYTLNDGRSTSVDVKISAAFEIDFKTEEVAGNPLAVRFVPINTGTHPVSWNFGDNTPISTEASPVHTYQIAGDEQTFVALLTVVEGPCTIIKDHTVTIRKPRPQVFDINPKVFCFRDDRPKQFRIDPAVTNINDITNPDRLRLFSDNGNIFFRPAEQALRATKNYSLTYKSIPLDIRIIVPDAGFTMNLVTVQTPVVTRPVTDISLTLKAKQTDASDYRWLITINQNPPVEFTEREIRTTFRQLRANADATITIVLVVNYERITQANCEDKKDYVLTPAIARNHLDRGEFDNVTPQ
jgi:hypothetical protein